MFFIEPSPQDIAEAMIILSNFQVKISSETDGVEKCLIKVEEAGDTDYLEHDLGLAEMTFSMNWHQKSRSICPDCISNSDNPVFLDEHAVCGHLVFTHPIRPAF